MPFAWTNLVKLHPDVEAGTLTEAVFAIDLGAIASGDPNVPVVNRGPEAFFRATYLTADLQKLMEEVLGSLDGIPEGKGFAHAENIAVAVFDGEKFDARNGK